MLDVLPKEMPAQLIEAKLTAIKNLITSKLFKDDGKYTILINKLWIIYVEASKIACILLMNFLLSSF